MTAPLDYTIAICTLDRAALLAQCLSAVLLDAVSTAERRGEIVVVDNGSADATAAVVASLCSAHPRTPMRYLIEPQRGLAMARNRALDEARGAIIAFLDDDAMVHSGWLGSCLDAFAMFPDTAAVGGEILPRSTIDLPDWFRPPLSKVYSVMSLASACGAPRAFPGEEHPLGANMAFRRSVFERRRFSPRLGRSGSDLISSEEAEIFFALRREGKAVRYVPGMRVDHVIDAARLTEAWAIRRYWFDGVSRARLRVSPGARLKDTAVMAAKLGWLPLSRPFARSAFTRLLWRCRLQKSLGFFAETLRELGFSERCAGAAAPPVS
jgi:glucosyl-dolichyl phosphate glucuronosyltransferase